MKITPTYPKKGPGSQFPNGFRVDVKAGRDAIFLATLLSYARRAGLDNMTPSERKATVKILEQLVAACESIDCDASGELEEFGPDYHATMKAFDPGYNADGVS